jgi:hypothetical protein
MMRLAVISRGIQPIGFIPRLKVGFINSNAYAVIMRKYPPVNDAVHH